MQRFETVDFEDDEDALDTSFANQFLKVFRRMAKAQWKTQQQADFSAQKVQEYLDEHGDLIDELKRQRADLEDENDQLRGFALEVLDLIEGFRETARQSQNQSMQSAASTMAEALESSMKKINLLEIPAIGEVPDGTYHFVVDTVPAGREEEKDQIIEVVEKGYTLRGEVLRKSKVVVAK